MDRFKDRQLFSLTAQIQSLKSNMDRFKVKVFRSMIMKMISLKSNMDRFKGTKMLLIPSSILLFKIQYG